MIPTLETIHHHNYFRPAPVDMHINFLMNVAERGKLKIPKSGTQPSPGTKLVLGYYYNHQRFGGGIHYDWLRNQNQFKSLAKMYASSPTVREPQFKHSLKPGFQAYHYYIKLHDEPGISCYSLPKCFNTRYNSYKRRPVLVGN